MPKWRDAWFFVKLALAYLILIEFLSLFPSGPPTCLVNLDEYAEYYAREQKCPPFHLFAIKNLASILEFFGDPDWVIALFTIILAGSTIGLWLATTRLWEAGERQLKTSRTVAAIQARNTRKQLAASERTAERQLRSYLGFHSGGVFPVENANFVEVFVKIRNFGLTPAHEAKAWLKFQRLPAGSSPWEESGNFGVPVVIPPTADFNLSAPMTTNGPQHNAVITNVMSYFVWGRVEYNDVFGNLRFLNFRCKTGGPIETVIFDGVRAQGWAWRPVNGMAAD